uniref:Putative secreted peptide n=1 Tax=Anopheles braziliensis TaxID=58242 RepID=A0A2M3ZPW5_9DIPT
MQLPRRGVNLCGLYDLLLGLMVLLLLLLMLCDGRVVDDAGDGRGGIVTCIVGDNGGRIVGMYGATVCYHNAAVGRSCQDGRT